MRWRPRRGRGDIEDRRGAGMGSGGLGIQLPVGGGIGGLIVLALIVLLATGVLGGGGTSPAPPGGSADTTSREYQFMKFIAGDVQDQWEQALREDGRPYERTKLVLFENGTQTGCGTASSQTGPFYCPVDRKVYLDLGFFRDLKSRFGAPGDFAQAYVIAHEFGHHVQNLTGIMDDVQKEQQSHPDEANELSIRLELQADCLAGVWGHSAAQEDLLDPGDLEEGLQAASAVGDDRIQKESTGRVNPESWTHGSSEQRVKWFRRGFDGGDTQACNTFKGSI
jgi:predicted metalloprotease